MARARTRGIAALLLAATAAACGLDAVGLMGAPGTGGPSSPEGGVVDAGGGPQPGDASTGEDAPPSIEPPNVLPEWTEKRLLTIDNTKHGAFTDFPVLVVLDASRIDFSKAKPNGDDLRFTDAAGTELSYEIETFGAGHAYVWVKMPAIAAASKAYVWMFYGYDKAPKGETPNAVWDASFVGVWHLADAKDSTGVIKGSANSGGMPVAGRIGPALSFDGASLHYFDTNSNDQLATFTVDVWFNAAKAPDQSGWYGPVMRDQNYGIGWDCNPTWWPKSAQSVSIQIAGSGDAGPCLQDWCRAVFADAAGIDALAVGVWHHVTATYDGATLSAYTNGKLRDAQAIAGTPANATGTTKLAANMGLSKFFAGIVDEVRISKIARSADWIAAQHESMTDTYVKY